MDEAGYSQHPSTAEDRRSLKALENEKSVAIKIDIRVTRLQ